MEENPTVTGEFTGRYTIEHELGRGGAAIVYLARDNRQERHVALKVLHKELAQAIGAKRFLREIKHSSALQHPHLLTILDSGESRGTLYYVMPYMADGSLRARIAKEKQLPVEEAISITRDVGEALAYAHSRGIVHRDIKPDNVLFSENHACLADFGIARAVDSVAADTLTSTGLVVGTPAYMSPEQASGEKRVDARSDQYSLACLLYEMITGLPPFIGATQQAVISQRFTQPPPSLRAHRPNVPEHVERAVKRALAIVPADRFPGVKEFIAALDEAGAVPATVSAHAIRRRWFAVGAVAAVVTLAVIAAKPGTEWVRSLGGPQVDTSKFVVLPFLSDEDPAVGKRVGDGVHAALREWQGLAVEGDVVVREVVDDAGGTVASLTTAKKLARELGAGRLIWGTVGRVGDETRIVAHLYDVRGDSNLTERSYAVPDRAPTDSALRRVAHELIGFGSLPRGVDDGYDGTRVYSALQAYRRGVLALRRFDLEVAVTELREAVRLDPDFAVAHLELARAENWQNPESRSSVTSARRAVALRDELRPRDARMAEALLAYAQQDYATACDRYAALVNADTLDAMAWYGLGECMQSDPLVVRDPRSRSGFRFRSSWHASGAAYLRALELEPAMHGLPHFRRLGMVFPTALNQIRPGETAGNPPVAFAGVPQLVAETLAHTPYPMPDFDRERDPAARERRYAALSRNRRILLDLAGSWARAYPRSAEAHTALASLQEMRGDFAGATTSLITATRLTTDPAGRVLLADAHARVLLKKGDFAGAKRVADSALASVSDITEENWEAVARLAGLSGRRARFAETLRFFWATYAGVSELDEGVSRAAGSALADAVVGVCEIPPPALERRLLDLLRVHVQPDRQRDVADRMIVPILSFSIPCASGRAVGTIRGSDPVVRAQAAFGLGDAARARAILDSASRSRDHVRRGDLSPTLIAREASLRLALGDTTVAIAMLDGTLESLPALGASFLSHPLENATVV
jgi:tRNA A-37 threonylcarbamoyl transferase component Bud32/tetratricopeptide (TPR) repeat protein